MVRIQMVFGKPLFFVCVIFLLGDSDTAADCELPNEIAISEKLEINGQEISRDFAKSNRQK